MTGISIIIATHNRAAETERTLRSLARMRFGACACEVIVVGNCCNDNTAAAVQRAAADFVTHHPLRYIEENRQGLSFARNSGIAAAEYDIVAFLDDDVDVEADWLDAMAAAYRSGNYAAVGGRAYLVYPIERPTWLGERDEGLLTKVELGPQQREACADELYGVNVSFDVAWIKKVGGFRTDLGRSGNILAGAEEVELLERIVAAGGRLLYEPAAPVGHRVAMGRLRRRWFWRRCFQGHVSAVRLIPPEQIRFYALLRSGSRAARAGAGAAAAVIRHGPTSESFFHEMNLVMSRWGHLNGTLRRLTWDREKSAPPSLV